MTSPPEPYVWTPDCQVWPLDAACLPEGWTEDPATWEAEQRRAVLLASEWLHLATARAYGMCLVHLRPCRRGCSDGQLELPAGVPFQPVLWDGQVLNITCGCTGDCGCGPLCEIKLPGPVYAVAQIKIDGVAINPNTYRVDNGWRLVRLGDLCWPDCQDLRLPDTAPNTWSVAYWHGRDIGALGRLAVTLLAKEYAKYCAGDSTCVLPHNVTNVRRGDLEYAIVNGPRRTNIRLVDDWVDLVNPAGLVEEMQIFSVDVDYGRHQTSPTPWPDGVPGGTPIPTWPRSYDHIQSTPATVWTIPHYLGFYPAGIRVEDPTGADVNGLEVTYLNINTITLTFNQPTAGVAHLS